LLGRVLGDCEMKSLQTLMAGIDQRIKANAGRAQAEQGALRVLVVRIGNRREVYRKQ